MSDSYMICEFCGGTFKPQFSKGPKPKYCSSSHRQRAYEQRDKERCTNRLQAIADAWDHYKPEMDVDGNAHIYRGTKLAALLDALTEEDNR